MGCWAFSVGRWLFCIFLQLWSWAFLFKSSLFLLCKPIPTVQQFSSAQQPSLQFWQGFHWSQVLFLCYSILSEAWVNWDLTPCHRCCVKWLINTEQETALALTNRAFSNQRCSWNVCPMIEPFLNPCEFREKRALVCPSVIELLVTWVCQLESHFTQAVL